MKRKARPPPPFFVTIDHTPDFRNNQTKIEMKRDMETKKKCLEEKVRNRRELASRLAAQNQDFPRPTGTALMQIMEVLMETLSERQSNLLQHMEVQYGLATRQTAERMLSEFMTEMTSLRNIFERMQRWSIIFNNSVISSDILLEDKFALELFVATLASGGNIEFIHDPAAHKGRGYRARIRRE